MASTVFVQALAPRPGRCICELFAGTTVAVLDDRFDNGERRFTRLARLKGSVLAVAHHKIFVPRLGHIPANISFRTNSSHQN